MHSLLMVAAVLLGAIAPAGAAADEIHAAVAARIQAVVEAAPAGGGPLRSASSLARLYRAVGYGPQWYLSDAAPERRQSVLEALSTLGSQGLEDLDPTLTTPLVANATPAEVAERDLALSAALLRHAGQLRNGAVPDAAGGAQWRIPADNTDPTEDLAGALRTGTLKELLASLPPPDPGYRRLTEALRRHRLILAGGGWQTSFGTTGLPLQGNDARLPALIARLMVEGDLDAGRNNPAPGELAAAVRRFQERHGLDADGRVGSRTLAELAVTTEQRINQILVNLERWRWMPHRPGDDRVEVNLAAATLSLIQGGAPTLQMRAIVGDERHPTPTIAAVISSLTLNPPWNVPPSIAVKEMLPRLRRTPGYLAVNDIVVLDRPDDPFGLTVDWHAVSRRAFPFRLQQRPGPRNALGSIKFEMLNPYDVYLHDTPDRRLFARSRRALSHGCVRLEQPLELASALLRNSSTPRTAQALESVIAAGETRRVALPAAVPVYLVYFTAFVDAAGRVQFRRDLYGRDAAIARALGLDRHQLISMADPNARLGGCPGQKAGATDIG